MSSDNIPNARAVAEKCAEIAASHMESETWRQGIVSNTAYKISQDIRAYAASLPSETPAIPQGYSKESEELFKDAQLGPLRNEDGSVTPARPAPLEKEQPTPYPGRREMQERIDQLERELSMAQKVISWANNSLYGSHGYFLSSRVDLPANEHHLDTPIEELKAYAGRQWNRAERLEAELKAAQSASAKKGEGK